MKRMISVFVIGIFLVATPAFGGVKVEQVEDTWEPSFKVTDSARYRIQNKRSHLSIFNNWTMHEKKMRNQGAGLCLAMGYRWMRVIKQTAETIDVACFNSAEKVPLPTRTLDCKAVTPSWMRSPPPVWLEKFKAKQFKAKRLKAKQKQD